MGMQAGENTLLSSYDVSGSIVSVNFNGTPYFYVKNLQGDVIGIVNAAGTRVASYYYDAWGNVLRGAESGIAAITPYRYRGYRYDAETGFYYLNSRYYAPTVKRFINADAYVSTGQGILGNNMFAYCLNNPVRFIDNAGTLPLEAARDLLSTWLFGDGEKQTYTEGSSIVDALKESSKMKSLANRAIYSYLHGKSVTDGDDIEFTPNEDGYNLYLAVQHFDYVVYVTEEICDKGTVYHDHQGRRYNVTIEVTDIYDFTNVRHWDSIGNILYNSAYYAHQGGVGNDYVWTAIYTYSTPWVPVQ